MKWSRTILAAAAALVMALASALLAIPASAHDPATGEKTIYQSNPLTSAPSACETDQWHWIINQVDTDAHKPAHIHVTFTDGTNQWTRQIPLSTPFESNSAHYWTREFGNEVTIVPSAVSAVIYDGWKGNFVLSHSPCRPNGTATIAIGPDPEINNVGPGTTAYPHDTSHTFTATVSGHQDGPAAIDSPVTINITITKIVNGNPVTVTPDSTTCGSVTVAAAPNNTTASCTATVTSSVPLGPLTANATASGTVGIDHDPFNVSTTGTGGNSGSTTKEFACQTHSLKLELDGAGKSLAAYNHFKGITTLWTVEFAYKAITATSWTVLDNTNATLSGPNNVGTNLITSLPFLEYDATTILTSASSPYTVGPFVWRFRILEGTTQIYSNGESLQFTLGNEGDCSLTKNAESPVGTHTIIKMDDLGAGISGWNLTAYSTLDNQTVPATTSGVEGSASITVDDLLGPWTLCENATGQPSPWTHWVEILPLSGDAGTVNSCGTQAPVGYVIPVNGKDLLFIFGNQQGTSTTATALAKADGTAVANSGHVPLGTSMKDTATVTPTPSGFAAPTGTVTFNLYKGPFTGDCTTGSLVSSETVNLSTTNSVTSATTSTSGALGAGSYAYKATYSGDTHYAGSAELCEPFTVDRGTLTLSTTLVGAATGRTPVIQIGGELAAGSLPRSVRDFATVNSGLVAGFTPSVGFNFFSTADCTGTSTSAGSAAVGNDNAADGSSAQSITSAGNYAFQAFVTNDANYNDVTATCENFTVTTVTIVKTANGSAATFNFTLGSQSPSVTTNGGTPNTGSTTVVVAAGNYTLQEATQTGWILVNISCPEPNGTASFNAAAGTNTTCTVENTASGATRTQGFWASHTAFSNNLWSTYVAPTNNNFCGTKTITAVGGDHTNQLMGAFWASINTKSDGKTKRTDLEQARMQLAQQLAAAMLNKYALSADDAGKVAAAMNAYCNNNNADPAAGTVAYKNLVLAIKNQVGILSTWNQSGDTVPLTFPYQHATPTASKAQAKIDYWDNPR